MLEAMGLTREVVELAAAADAHVGRVTHVTAGVARVLTEAGNLRATCGGRLLARVAIDPLLGPCAGDWAVLRDWPDRRVTLERVAPRRTTVLLAPSARRPSAGRSSAVANVDLVLASPPRREGWLSTGDVDEALAVCRSGGTVLLLATSATTRGALLDLLTGGRVGCLAGEDTLLVPGPEGGALVTAVVPVPEQRGIRVTRGAVT